jgi:hypothetical protein
MRSASSPTCVWESPAGAHETEVRGVDGLERLRLANADRDAP